MKNNLSNILQIYSYIKANFCYECQGEEDCIGCAVGEIRELVVKLEKKELNNET